MITRYSQRQYSCFVKLSRHHLLACLNIGGTKAKLIGAGTKDGQASGPEPQDATYGIVAESKELELMKLGILISGRGSNMVALVDAVKSGEIPASEVAVVISDKPDAAGLEKGRERGIETVVVERKGRSPEDHDAEIIRELSKRGVELVCLAGYMRLLSASFVKAFPNGIINIHPSLLPAFPGLDAQQQAFDAGVEVTGCTVHYVDELLDHGQVILQHEVARLPDDTVETLSSRILEQEHALYIEALKIIVAGEPASASQDSL